MSKQEVPLLRKVAAVRPLVLPVPTDLLLTETVVAHSANVLFAHESISSTNSRLRIRPGTVPKKVDQQR